MISVNRYSDLASVMLNWGHSRLNEAFYCGMCQIPQNTCSKH